MKRCCGLLLALLCCCSSFARPWEPTRLSPAEFVRELGQLRGRVQELAAKPQLAPALEAELPRSWKVQTARGAIEVPTEFARQGLESFLRAAPAQKPQRRQELDDSLAVLQAQAHAYEQAEPVPSQVHQRLDQILQTREFRGLRGPTPLQLLWERLLSWLQRQAEKAFPRIPSATDAGPLFAWCVIALVCCAFAIWLYRRWRQAEQELMQPLIPPIPAANGWRNWLSEARASADRGQWREAIHLSFWAAVSKLEAENTWPPDRTRTPREYLRAIPEWNSARPAFQQVMRSFERVWYGQLPATADDFHRVLTALERMDCR